MSDSPTLVSACLLGARCRYDGASKPHALTELEGPIQPVCPEMMAGFGVPRPAIERGTDGRVRVLATGQDVTDELAAAASRIVATAKGSGVKVAILKERSPSCGSRELRRGGAVVAGSGILTDALRAAGIEVRSEEQCG